MHKKFTSLSGLFGGAALLGMALAGQAAAEEITVWAWDPNFNGAVMEEAAARYQKDHPDVTFNIVDFAKSDVEQKLQTQLAAGLSDGLPDIVLIEDRGAQKYLLSFPGAFEPLNDVIDYSNFADYKVALAGVGDETYSVPFDSGVVGWFYRSDILAEAGFGADDLKDITWSRFIEIAKAVHDKTGVALVPLDLQDPSYIKIMLQSAGSWYFDESGSLNLADNAAFKEALSVYREILMTPEIYKTTSGWGEYTGSFMDGTTAGVISGVWMTGTVKAAKMEGKWAIAPVPRLGNIEGAVNASNFGGSSWYVLASSEERETAKDFLATVWGSDVDFYQTILTERGAVGSFLPAREGEAYSSSDDYFGKQAIWSDFSSWVEKVPAINYGIFTNEVDAAVVAQIPALADGMDVDEAVKRIEAQARSQIQ
jgi:lactose/L-arabinose transport system substrate-binding protein